MVSGCARWVRHCVRRRVHADVSRGVLAMAATVVLLVGCDTRLASLTGTVTIDGHTAPKGLSLEFTPTGQGSSSYASTDAAGRYEAAFTFRKKGIQPGEHRVRLLPSAVETPMPVIGPNGQPMPERTAGASLAKLPRRYYEEIEILTVTPGRNEHDIALTSAED
jgi:hypothetical protein